MTNNNICTTWIITIFLMANANVVRFSCFWRKSWLFLYTGIATTRVPNINLCDLETDITNHRYTLVYYIGKTTALKLYQVLYFISFVAMVLAVIFQIAPILMLGTLVVGIPVYQNIQLFLQKQEKRTTFALAIKNMVMIHVMQMLLLVLSVIFFR